MVNGPLDSSCELLTSVEASISLVSVISGPANPMKIPSAKQAKNAMKTSTKFLLSSV